MDENFHGNAGQERGKKFPRILVMFDRFIEHVLQPIKSLLTIPI